jgi:integrase/recombinase XerD
VTLARGLALYVAALKARGFSDCTGEAYARALVHFGHWLESEALSDLADVDSAVAHQYQAFLVHRTSRFGRPLALSTQHLALVAVKGFFSFLVQRGHLLVNPAQALILPRQPRREIPLNLPTEREIERLLEAVDTRRATGVRNRAVLEVLYSTGLRIGELKAVRMGDVDLVEGTLTVVRGKGGSGRLVPLGREACDWIHEYLSQVRPLWTRHRSSDRLFVTWWGKPLCDRTLLAALKALVKKIGLKKRMTLHTFRHACASHMLARGADVRVLQLLLGHRQLTTTAIYTHVDLSLLKSVHRKCHPRARIAGDLSRRRRS